MPIYEYRRPDGTTFEIQQSFSEDPLTIDPDTGVRVERVLHPPAVHFKGKGFYSTDYGTRKRERETVAAAEGSAGAASNGAGPDKPAQADKSASADSRGKPESSAKKAERAGAAASKR